MGTKSRRFKAVKFTLNNYHCGKCATGVVQIHQQLKRGGVVTTTVSGCLDCGYDYGIGQSNALKPCPENYGFTWA